MLGERRSRAGWCADLSEAFKNPDVEEPLAGSLFTKAGLWEQNGELRKFMHREKM